MATRSRVSIDARLAELEARRDMVSQNMVNRLWQRCDELLGRERVTTLLEGHHEGGDWPAEIVALIDSDPELVELNNIAGRLYGWRQAYETLTGKRRSQDAD